MQKRIRVDAVGLPARPPHMCVCVFEGESRIDLCGTNRGSNINASRPRTFDNVCQLLCQTHTHTHTHTFTHTSESYTAAFDAPIERALRRRQNAVYLLLATLGTISFCSHAPCSPGASSRRRRVSPFTLHSKQRARSALASRNVWQLPNTIVTARQAPSCVMASANTHACAACMRVR